jgi:hypothetical protein
MRLFGILFFKLFLCIWLKFQFSNEKTNEFFKW